MMTLQIVKPAKAAKKKGQPKGPRIHWSLPLLMEGLHARVEQDLRLARELIGHAPGMGEASQNAWIRLFQTYLPERYQACSATVMDSDGNFSEQIDVVIYDRQYSPFLLHADGQVVVPIEAVYAVFETKQDLIIAYVQYAQKKVASVRRLNRTSVRVPTINGHFVKKPQPILGGYLALDSGNRTSLTGEAMLGALKRDRKLGRLDMGCIAAVGTFGCGGADSTTATEDKHAATTFLLELMSQLQACGTVPAIDYRAYAKWLRR
jgi:hypothetical protein